jgi:hypothetical protein
MNAHADSIRFDTEALCAELSQIVERGPGENPEALRRVKDVIDALAEACPNADARIRVRDLFFQFEEWFHVARWRQYGPSAERLRTHLNSEIAAVRRELAGPTTTR